MRKAPSPEAMWSVDVQCRRNGGLRGSGGWPPGLRFEHPSKLPGLPASWSDQKPSTRSRWTVGSRARPVGLGQAARPNKSATGAALSCEVQSKSGEACSCSSYLITDLEQLKIGPPSSLVNTHSKEQFSLLKSRVG